MLKQGLDRNQLQMLCLETTIDSVAMVRVIDAFVDMLDLEDLEFELKGKIKNGAPAYPAADLLKLYYYGYLNRIRSSRRLEREAKTNLEAIWITRGLQAGYKTIANFRKDNKKALVKAFYRLNVFLKGEDLFDKDRVAIDGFKIRAQNSKKNNYNEKKVTQHLDYIDRQTKQYLEELDQLDKVEETEAELEQRIEISQKLDHLKIRKDKYADLKKKIEVAKERGETQISTTDPDARALPKKMNIVEVSYNVQAAADLKNKLITNIDVLNKNDTNALSAMALAAKKVLGKQAQEKITALADKGYDTGLELKTCIENNIETLVSPKKRVSPSKDKAFNKSKFEYDEEHDVYICPEGLELRTNGNWYKKNNGKNRKSYRVKHYKLAYKLCNACPNRLKCAGASNLKRSKGRYIERSEYQDYVDENIDRVKYNKELYRKRQETIEHPFGTIKRQWGYDYTLLKGIEKVKAEYAIIFTCYNLRRTMSILGIAELIKRLKTAYAFVNALLWLNLKPYQRIFLEENKLTIPRLPFFCGHSLELCAFGRVNFL